MPFVKGKSGNPAGKTPGTKHRTTRLVEEIMEKGTRSVVETMLGLAKKGDVAAAILILERVLPLRRTRPIEFTLPAEGGPVAALGAVASGSLSPDEGQAVAAMIEAQRRAIETVELEDRLRAVEKAVAERPR